MLTYTQGASPKPSSPKQNTKTNETLPHTISITKIKSAPECSTKIFLQTEYAAPRGYNQSLAEETQARLPLHSRWSLFH